MKQLYRITLLTVFTCGLLASCDEKEKEETSPSIAGQLEGRWTKSLIRLQYFDSSGRMDFEDRVTEENGVVYELKNGTLKATYLNGDTDQASYKLIRRDGKDYVEISNGTNKVKNEVVSISDNKLIWQDDYEHLEYYNGSLKTADKATYIEEFTK